jgi:hypothetical protein
MDNFADEIKFSHAMQLKKRERKQRYLLMKIAMNFVHLKSHGFKLVNNYIYWGNYGEYILTEECIEGANNNG